MIAGRDTTACLLTWAIYELNEHPDMEEKMLQEINECLAASGQYPTYESVMRDLPYTHAFLSETVRLHPPVPSDSKTAVHDDVLPDGTFIPAGSKINYQPYVFGRLKSLWGPDADEFKPERWLAMEKEPPAYKFLSFNGGPRLCLGKQLAYYEAKMLLAMLLPKYKFVRAAGHDPAYKISIILQMKNGFPCHPIQRKSETK